MAAVVIGIPKKKKQWRQSSAGTRGDVQGVGEKNLYATGWKKAGKMKGANPSSKKGGGPSGVARPKKENGS